MLDLCLYEHIFKTHWINFQVEDNLAKVRNAGTEQDLGIQYKALKPEVDKLNIMAAKRQQVLCRWRR